MCSKDLTNKLSYQELWLIFILGCLFGSIYETIYVLIKNLIINGSVVYELNTGVIYGPFNVIYGLGVVVITILLTRKKYSNWNILLRGALIGGLIEYIISFLQEVFTGTTSWDYSNYFLNIHGRTTIIYMIFWGIICFFFVKEIYPIIDNFYHKINNKLGSIILKTLIIFLCLDMFISFSAIIRQYLRRQNIKTFTFYGDLLDKYYPDERLKKVYTNMEVK